MNPSKTLSKVLNDALNLSRYRKWNIKRKYSRIDAFTNLKVCPQSTSK